MRSLSALVLGIFLIGPGLRAECLLLCTRGDQPAARSTCHDESADADQIAIAGLHGCADSGPALITLFKPAATDSAMGRVGGTVVSTVVARSAMTDRILHGPPGSAPPTPLLIPLRI